MKSVLKWIGIVLVVLFVIGLVAGPDATPPGGEAAPSAVAVAQKEVFHTTAADLFRAYEANEVATDEQMKGKIVEMTGTIQAIDKDFMDKMVIRLATPNQFMPASLYVDDSMKNKVMSLQKGTKITVRCESMSRMVGAPHGSDCRF